MKQVIKSYKNYQK